MCGPKGADKSRFFEGGINKPPPHNSTEDGQWYSVTPALLYSLHSAPASQPDPSHHHPVFYFYFLLCVPNIPFPFPSVIELLRSCVQLLAMPLSDASSSSGDEEAGSSEPCRSSEAGEDGISGGKDESSEDEASSKEGDERTAPDPLEAGGVASSVVELKTASMSVAAERLCRLTMPAAVVDFSVAAGRFLLPLIPAEAAALEIGAAAPEAPVAASEVSVAASEVSVAASEVPVAASEVSVAASEVPVAASEVSVAASEVSVAASEVSVAASEVPVAASEVSVAADLPVVVMVDFLAVGLYGSVDSEDGSTAEPLPLVPLPFPALLWALLVTYVATIHTARCGPHTLTSITTAKF